MWLHETISTGRAHEARFEGPLGLDSQISKEDTDGGCRHTCARPHSANSTGARDNDSVRQGGERPHSRSERIRPHVDVSRIVQWLKGISSRIMLQEFASLRRMFWGRHWWARGYLAVSTGNLTDEMVQAYIAEQEGEPVHDDSRFVIDTPPKLPPSRRQSLTPDAYPKW